MASSSKSPRILAIHAHPDDIEFQCAGTLALLSQLDCAIAIATMTPGDCGTVEHSAEEISAIRRNEAKKSAKMIGTEYHCLEFRDLAIPYDVAARKRVTEFLRQTRPDIVITAPPIDYMADHEVTSQLVRDACFAAPVPNYCTQQESHAKPLERIPALYFVDAVEGADHFGNPLPWDFIVDISETFALKLKMLACHESQRNWLKQQHGMDDYLNSCKRWSAKRGENIGKAYGEAFRQYKGHPYPTENRLLALLEKSV